LAALLDSDTTSPCRESAAIRSWKFQRVGFFAVPISLIGLPVTARIDSARRRGHRSTAQHMP